jgi:CheY-like chemotaxis protein
VLTATTGKEAIEVFRANKQTIDLVLLDMIMPDLSGGKTYDAIRKVNPAAKVLLASGYALEGEASSIMARGCSGFIQKPYTLRAMSHKIREILEKQQP